MNRVAIILTVVVSLAGASTAMAQGKPDFSGQWVFNQGKSGKETAGNSAVLPFASELEVKQGAAEITVASATVRQKPVTATYKLDGSPVKIEMTGGVTETSEARIEGANLVITTRRTFTSPIGEVNVNFKEVWSVNGNLLTIQKTRSSELDNVTATAVFDKK